MFPTLRVKSCRGHIIHLELQSFELSIARANGKRSGQLSSNRFCLFSGLFFSYSTLCASSNFAILIKTPYFLNLYKLNYFLK